MTHGDPVPIATVAPVIECSFRRRFLFVLTLVAGLLLSACADPAPEAANGDPVLDRGRTIWVNQCQSCHGSAGGGGRGNQLNEGKVLERYPFIEDQIALVLGGRGGMPAYAGRLSEAEVEAVVRYTREVLNTELPADE